MKRIMQNNGGIVRMAARARARRAGILPLALESLFTWKGRAGGSRIYHKDDKGRFHTYILPSEMRMKPTFFLSLSVSHHQKPLCTPPLSSAATLSQSNRVRVGSFRSRLKKQHPILMSESDSMVGPGRTIMDRLHP